MSQTGFVSASGRAKVVVVLFSLLIAIIAGTMLLVAIGLLTRPDEFASLIDDSDPSLFVMGYSLLAVGRALVFVLLVVFYLLWLHRAYSNLPALDAMGLEYSPTMAVGSWFIPFANLVIPYKVVSDLWYKSDPMFDDPTEDWQRTTPPMWLSVWWGCWIIGNVLSRVSTGLTDNAKTVKDLVTALQIDMVMDLVVLAAAMLGLLVVRGIDKRQTVRSQKIGAAVSNLPPAPPVFR